MAAEVYPYRARAGLVVGAVACLLLVCQLASCVAGSKAAINGLVDFRAFYAAGTILRTGHAAQLYDYDYQNLVQLRTVGARTGALPFLYPAFAALPFAPLSLLSYRAALAVWTAINLGLLLWAASLIRPWLAAGAGRRWWTLPALFCCLFGVSVAMMQGQISFVLLVIYSAAWSLLRKDRLWVAGLVMSLGLMKFQTAIPIVVLFIVWRQWKVIAGFAAGGAVLGLISVGLVGIAGAQSYWSSMTGMARQTAMDPKAAHAHYGMLPVDMPNIHGLTYGVTHGASWGIFLNILLCALVMIFAARQRASLLIALPAAMLVSYHMQPHDLVLLLLPLSVEIDAILRKQVMGRYMWMMGGCVALLTLPIAAIVMITGKNYLVAFAVFAVTVMAMKLRSDGADELLVAPVRQDASGARSVVLST